MGARSGGGTGKGRNTKNGGLSARAQQLAKQYLGGVQNPALKKELAKGFEAFEKEFGIPRGVRVVIKNLGPRTGGDANGSTGEIRINKRFETGKFDISHAETTIIHELTHLIDKSDLVWDKNVKYIKNSRGRFERVLKPENKRFEKKLTGAYRTFKINYGSPATKQIGSYALKNKHEFFAESLASYMAGIRNQYTIFAYKLAKLMK